MTPDLPRPGRRSAGTGRRWSLPAVLAVVLPVLTALVLLPVRAHEDPEPEPVAPQRVALGRADLGCPASLPGATDVLVASLAKSGGMLSLRTTRGAKKQTRVPVAQGRPGRAEATDPLVVTGTQSLAPGLLAGRVGTDPVSATICPAPGSEQWFTGLGARATHASTLELVNPDPVAAVVDLTLWSTRGEVDAGSTTGLAVPGRGVVRLDLSAAVPDRSLLAARVVVPRGRVAASVVDTTDPVGAGPAVREWLPGQATPEDTVLLPGLPKASGHRLLVANPGEDEARVEVQLVGRSTFTPTTSREVRVAAGTLQEVPLRWLRKELRRSKDTVAVRLSSTQPVVASLHAVTDGDAVVTGAPSEITGTGAAVLPGRGETALVLAGATTAGTAEVTLTDLRGRELSTTRVRLAPGTGTRLDLPARTGLVRVDVEGTPVTAAVELTGRGAAVLPLVEPAAEGLVPAVRPAGP